MMNRYSSPINTLSIILVLFISLTSSCFADSSESSLIPSYHWGRGLQFEAANFNIGGYVNITFEHSETDKNVATLDDLSFLVNWSPHARLRFFSEFEMENWFDTEQGGRDFSSSFSLERLYVDLLISNSFSLRLGQFLTPVGRWNTIHANPLVWTTSRPIVTKSDSFPSRTNGLMFSKQYFINQKTLDIDLYFDDSEDFDPRQIEGLNDNNPQPEEAFEWAMGTHIEYSLTDSLDVGISYLRYKKRSTSSLSVNHLFGVDLLWRKRGYEIQLEFAHRFASDNQKNETNAYLQGVIPLGYNLFAVGRYEFLSGRHSLFSNNINGTTHVFVPALAWRPYSPLVIKAEYRLGDNNKLIAPSGFFASISMLF